MNISMKDCSFYLTEMNSNSSASLKRVKRDQSLSVSDKSENKSFRKSLDQTDKTELESNSHIQTVENGKNSEVHIMETYQLGYMNGPPESNPDVFIFDHIDGIQINYPMKFDPSDSRWIELDPILFSPKYKDKLLTLSDSALEKLATQLTEWLDEFDLRYQADYIWRHLHADRSLTTLRQQIYALLNVLVPRLHVHDNFDPKSPEVDRLIYRLSSQLSAKNSVEANLILQKENNSPTDAIPVLALSDDPELLVTTLQRRILLLLTIILPELRLPDSFDVKKDLPDLLKAIHSHNTQSHCE